MDNKHMIPIWHFFHSNAIFASFFRACGLNNSKNFENVKDTPQIWNSGGELSGFSMTRVLKVDMKIALEKVK